MTIDYERGTGRTTEQMKAAPRGAVYVSPHPFATDYVRKLAAKILREDLRIVEPSWLDHGWHGKILEGIVVDHACHLDDHHRQLLLNAETRIR